MFFLKKKVYNFKREFLKMYIIEEMLSMNLNFLILTN